MIGEAVSEEIEVQETEEVVSEEIETQKKCTKQFVLIAKTNVKFRSSQQKIDLFTVGTVLEITRGSKFIFLYNSHYFFLFFKS